MPGWAIVTRQVYVAMVAFDSADDGYSLETLQVFSAGKRAEQLVYRLLRAEPDVGEVRRMARGRWIAYPRITDRHGGTTEVTGYGTVHRRVIE